MILVLCKIITELGNTCEDAIFQSAERCNNLLYRQFQIMFIKSLSPLELYSLTTILYIFSYSVIDH